MINISTDLNTYYLDRSGIETRLQNAVFHLLRNRDGHVSAHVTREKKLFGKF